MSDGGTILGIDLGGTKIALALYDADMQQCDARTIPTPAKDGFDVVLSTIVAEAGRIIRPDTRAVGIGIPGMIDARTGCIRTLPNIPGADGKDIGRLLGTRLSLPVTVENDARCFAYAEAVAGAGKGHAVVLGITLGTGVGGGIVIGGKLYRGACGIAGEIGHALLRPGEPPYPSADLRGDVEQFLSGTAMGRRCEAARKPEEYLEGAVCSFMQPQVFREVAWLIANAIHFVDPSIVLLGGSVGRALRPHLPAIQRELPAWLLPCIPVPDIAVGALSDPSRRGAALLAAERRPA